MLKMGNWRGCALIVVIAAIALICTSVYAEQSSISGTLSAKLDEKAGTVTAMFVGYCQGDPVMIGPITWKSDAQEFTRESLNEIGDKLCGSNNSIKKVTRTVNTGKEIVAEIVVTSEKPSVLVGR
jgi:hypothetical protein